jgi:hypothetical protein
MGTKVLTSTPPAPLVIGRGGEATVHLDRARRTVTKVYRSADFEAARRAAAREFRILGQVYGALREIAGASSPRPIALHETPPAVRMEFRDGPPLAAHLARHRMRGAEIAQIAGALARALHAYVLATGEAYYDFSLQNTLIDIPAGDIVLVDFGMPQAQRSLHGRYTPMRMSVGNFLGWSLYDLARPASLASRLARTQSFRLYRAMRDALLKAGDLQPEDLPQVESVARMTYGNLTRTGPVLRRAWYRMAGALWLPWALAQAHRGLESGGRTACDKSISARSARATGCKMPST